MLFQDIYKYAVYPCLLSRGVVPTDPKCARSFFLDADSTEKRYDKIPNLLYLGRPQRLGFARREPATEIATDCRFVVPKQELR